MNLRSISRMGLRDRIGFFSNFPLLRSGIVKVLSSVQTEKLPELGILAIAAAHVLVAEELNIDPHALIAQVRNMVHDASGPFCDQIHAMKAYIKGELNK